MATAALAVALSSAMLRAESLTLGASHADLGSALMMRLFGEVSDSNASFAAAYGDRSSESPLRELALQIASVNKARVPAVAFAASHVASHDVSNGDVSYLAQAAAAGLLRNDAPFNGQPTSDSRSEERRVGKEG